MKALPPSAAAVAVAAAAAVAAPFAHDGEALPLAPDERRSSCIRSLISSSRRRRGLHALSAFAVPAVRASLPFSLPYEAGRLNVNDPGVITESERKKKNNKNNNNNDKREGRRANQRPLVTSWA